MAGEEGGNVATLPISSLVLAAALPLSALILWTNEPTGVARRGGFPTWGLAYAAFLLAPIAATMLFGRGVYNAGPVRDERTATGFGCVLYPITVLLSFSSGAAGWIDESLFRLALYLFPCWAWIAVVVFHEAPFSADPGLHAGVRVPVSPLAVTFVATAATAAWIIVVALGLFG